MPPATASTIETRAPRLATRLDRFGGATALVAGDEVVTYHDLADRVRARARALGPGRRLVSLRGGNDVELVVTYLAALAAGHVVHLAGAGSPAGESFRLTFRPDVEADVSGDGLRLAPTGAPPTGLHPDLALLMSTSGSTGSAKLVRLSAANLDANAAAIVEVLGLDSGDRAVTSLPLHYCYGLSVLNSHLSVGASVVLTGLSVTEPCFWDLVRRHGVTTLAGVPHTFDLLDRVPEQLADAPRLRRLTQAGGRLAPDAVVRHARRAREQGRDLHVMYGQTEATARMACLAPELACEHPDSVGRAIPGGRFEIRTGPGDEPGTGEVVYHGPNVMLGYAETPADLALGRTCDELATGDLGRLDDDGRLYLVGRRSRFVKVYGLRIDPGRVEAALTASGFDAMVAGDDDGLVVGLSGPDDGRARDTAATAAGLPAHAVETVHLDPLPRLDSGKPDLGAVLHAGRTRAVDRTGDDESVRDVYGRVLGLRPGAIPGDATFAGLGGDSLSYVETSIRLERLRGDLPADWHLRPVADLERGGVAAAAAPGTVVETNVVLRAVAIVLIVGTHMGLFTLGGGAHVLLGVAGFNFARFQLGRGRAQTPVEWTRDSLRSVARIAIPTSAWIGLNMLVVGGYGIGTVLLVNNYTGSSWRRDGRWQYWYLEVLVQILLVATVVFAIPAVRRLERRWPFAFVAALAVPAVLLRWEVVQLGDPYNHLFRTHTVLWAFLLGWAAHAAVSDRQRLVVSAGVLAAVPGFFDDAGRDARVAVGLLLLVWLVSLRVPTVLVRPIGLLAGASLYVYLVHWQLYPPLKALLWPVPALVATLAGGVLVWFGVEAARRRILRSR